MIPFPGRLCGIVLEKYGITPNMLSVIRSFHEGMLAKVQIGEATADDFEVKNGLRQGCCLAPSLFNLFFSADGQLLEKQMP